MKNPKKALNDLNIELEKEVSSKPIQFNKFLDLAAEKPNLVFRNVFQLFHDMVHYYVPKGHDERDSIGLINYDFSQLLTQDVEDPFFADVLLSDRLMHLTEGFQKGLQSNRIVLFEGPPGSGKSIFLNNLISKFEEFTKKPEGMTYETLWRLDTQLFGGMEHKINGLKYLDVPCPNHDHPILQIPRTHRKKFLDELIEDKEFRDKLFKKKEYEWIFKGSACSICTSIYRKLIEILGNPKKAFEMLFTRHYKFDRQLGEGVSIFNSTDPITKKPHKNEFLQKNLSELLKDSNAVQYVYSDFAKTNNGVFALMDIKENNCERLKNLYGIASDEIHKVENIEERINSLFIGLINPEDTKQYKDFPSFRDRITTVRVPYVMDYNTEIEIYQSKFSGDLKSHFLPRILENFAKLIISSRLSQSSKVLNEWIGNTIKYEQYLDENKLLLKIELYSGDVPTWLTEEDRKKFTPKIRKKLIKESQTEGFEGFSGRRSIEILNSFSSSYKRGKPITMKMLSSFFEHDQTIHKRIPEGFLDSMVNMYDFEVLQEIKESLYNYNEERISHEVQNYLFAINFELGNKEKCIYTGDFIEITDEYFKSIEDILLGKVFSQTSREILREGEQKTYASKTLATEINVENKSITKTEQYKHLFEKYSDNIKENVLLPLIVNDNFRRAIQDYGTGTFDSYDKKLQQDVLLLIENLQKKFHYTEESAKQVCIYVLDKDLTQKFGEKEKPGKKTKINIPFGGTFR